MKNKILTIILSIFCVFNFILSVDAKSDSKNIDGDVCENIYTNYYFMLEANTENYFNQGPLSSPKYTHSNRAIYNNNTYLTNFDSNNVGYGQIEVSTSSKTENLKSLSLDEYYNILSMAIKNHGVYSTKFTNYIVGHDWHKQDSDNNWIDGSGALDPSDFTREELKAATLDADSIITQVSPISNKYTNPFVLQIKRTYKGTLTGKPISSGKYKWYIQPAVYYVQYCSPAEKKGEYKIEYFPNANGDKVTNMPETFHYSYNDCGKISNLIPKREGYEFLGWTKNPNSTDISYIPGLNYEYCDGNLKLYAVWKKKENIPPVNDTYKIIYNKNTSDTVYNLPNNVVKDINENATISTLIPSRDNYKFLGWSTDANNKTGDNDYAPGSIYTDRKDLTLYAIWEKIDDNKKEEIVNPQTGISNFILPTISLIGLSSGALYILKKKNSFRQF